MHLCRSSSNVPRLPTFLKLLQNRHVLLTFGKVPNISCACHAKPHPNFRKWSETISLLHFSLPNVLRATTVCTFSTCQLPKAVRHWGFLCILTSKCALRIPLTISTTKRVNTCLIPSPVSWRIQAKKMDPRTSFCSKRACTASCSGVPFGTQKSEMHFVVIYFGMRCAVPETSGHFWLLTHDHFVVRWAPKNSKKAFKKEKWDRFGFKTNQLNLKLCA